MKNYMKLCICVVFVFLGVNQILRFHSYTNDQQVQKWDMEPEEELEDTGTTWALLVAGSNGFHNFRHQADVCHVYQTLKRGGLKDENIVVFMYDDIASHEDNGHYRGNIVHTLGGEDVYAGVPKDYTGENLTLGNFYAVLTGDKSRVEGGSGKTINSKSNDRIFIYYSGHGKIGTLGMPDGEAISSTRFIDELQKMDSRKKYKSMAIYIEACHSGSMLPLPSSPFQNKRYLNIYVMTATAANETSLSTACYLVWPSFKMICRGNLFTAFWLEDSEIHNRKKRSLGQQFDTVQERMRVHVRDVVFGKFQTVPGARGYTGTHVMEFGRKHLKVKKLYVYQGFDPNWSQMKRTVIM